MPVRSDSRKAELIDAVRQLVRDRLPKPRAKIADRFVRLYYRHVPIGDIAVEPPPDLYGAALSLWQFGAERQRAEAKVRAYNPSYDENGWHSGHTVVEAITDNMPFLVDSVTAGLNELGLTVHRVMHPVVRVVRDEEGRITDLAIPDTDPPEALAESFMHLEVDEQGSAEALQRIEVTVRAILADVRAAVSDWKVMRDRLIATIAALETTKPPVDDTDIDEVVAFLKWIDTNQFTFLGYREYRFDRVDEQTGTNVVAGSGLGILRNRDTTVFEGLRRDFAVLPQEMQRFVTERSLLTVTKANRRSTVHRAVHLDTVIVKSFSNGGDVVGERLFAGLFTSSAYTESPRDIPFLRRKVGRVMERTGFEQAGHSAKALQHILDTYPRDELYQIGEDALFEIALGILHLRERQRTALFTRQDPFERFVSCLVYIPRDRYNTELRTRIQHILERAFDGTTTAFYTMMAETVHARLQFIIKTIPGKVPAFDPADVEAALVAASRSWSDHLRAALVEAKGEEQGLALVRRYRAAFPASYRERTIAPAAIFDIDRIEEVIAKGGIALNLYRPIEAEAHRVDLKLYQAGDPITLSQILPILEHLGLQVIGEHPHQIEPLDSDEPVWVHDFVMQSSDGSVIDLDTVKAPFQEAFVRIWHGELEDDSLNRLVLLARLGWREVMVLRAYARYLRQARVPFSQDVLAQTLAASPAIARDIVALFHARLDPSVEGRPALIGAVQERLTAALESVENLDEDLILRRFINVVSVTVRTNYFQLRPDGAPKPYLAVKLRSAGITHLPLPHPWREIFVYAPRMEGVHLRGGPVARGGIRWSDRREDFRTEILDLMKAQMVKNGVIVPVGSKGGFVVKRPPPASAGREAAQKEGVACYRWFMQGLLDVTDNRQGTAILPPDRVIRHDEDDPYLVVAADKGTATFSDIANAIAQDYGFWLDDAFASGGSAGYDHKKMGITARGAWESVKRHFREMGTDIQRQDFTVIGVGDMSGDVFGNGMLLSRHIRLIAAFNHLHIFVDPDPDPERSFVERERLFLLGRGSWDQYDRALLSPGGAVFDRRAKAVRPTAEMRACFGLTRDSLTPNELITALLKSEVDLLWFGGIGTYVKAQVETQAVVGDKANDALRIDAPALRARVIGEGANLALTQRGRIEAAKHGCRLNTDFIDNSAGVDCSDHEVNIKILLGSVVGAGDLTVKHRNALLEEMTDEVAALVLRDNYLQSQAISLAMAEGPEALERFARMIRALEKSGRLNRTLEDLPDEEEIGDRVSRREGLTRPEQSVLLAYAKIVLFDDLMASALPNDPGMSQALRLYFPTALRDRFEQAMGSHPLRREIVATSVTNELVNRMGPTFVSEVCESTGMASVDVARCYAIACDSFVMPDLWGAIEALDTQVAADVQLQMLLATKRLMERAIEWLFRYGGERPSIAGAVDRYGPAIRQFGDDLERLLPDDARAELAERVAHWRGLGVPDDLARRIAGLAAMAAALDLIRVARACAVTPAEAAPLYFELGSALGLAWLRERAQRLPATGHWRKQAVAAVVDELFAVQADLAAAVLRARTESRDSGYGVGEWLASRRASVDRIRQLIADLKAADPLDLAMLTVASRRLRALVV